MNSKLTLAHINKGETNNYLQVDLNSEVEKHKIIVNTSEKNN